MSEYDLSKFEDFVGKLEIGNWAGPGENGPESIPDSLRRSENDPNFFQLEIATARFGVRVNRAGDEKGVNINFSSHPISFRREELWETVNQIIDLGFVKHSHKPTPHVVIIKERGLARLDLRSAWDYEKYKEELDNDSGIRSIFYHLTPSPPSYNFVVQTNQPKLIYGFRRDDVLSTENFEYLHLSPAKAGAETENIELLKFVLHRNREYLGVDDSADAIEFSRQIGRITDEAFSEKPLKFDTKTSEDHSDRNQI